VRDSGDASDHAGSGQVAGIVSGGKIDVDKFGRMIA